MAIGDIYQLTTFFEFVSLTCNNVFHYELVSGTDVDHTESLWEAWVEDVREQMMNCMADTCQLQRVEIVNLMDVEEFRTQSGLDQNGDIVSGATQTAASFVSFGFRLEKAYPGAPNGYKRFPGVAEGYTAENVYDPPGAVTGILAISLEDDINAAGFDDIFHLQIVHRPYSFAVPPTTWWPVNEVTYTNLTTQSSRKG